MIEPHHPWSHHVLTIPGPPSASIAVSIVLELLFEKHLFDMFDAPTHKNATHGRAMRTEHVHEVSAVGAANVTGLVDEVVESRMRFKNFLLAVGVILLWTGQWWRIMLRSAQPPLTVAQSHSPPSHTIACATCKLTIAPLCVLQMRGSARSCSCSSTWSRTCSTSRRCSSAPRLASRAASSSSTITLPPTASSPAALPSTPRYAAAIWTKGFASAERCRC
jgi:hypothetical protein